MCWQLDNPAATAADYYRMIREKIDRCGWTVQWIERSKLYPDWAYTVGLSEHDLLNWSSPVCNRTEPWRFSAVSPPT